MTAEIAAVVDAASSSLRDGAWVAGSIRKPFGGEFVSHSKWLSQFGVNAHHSKKANGVVMSMWSSWDLRMAEFGNVGTVLGEKLSSMSMLAYEGVGDLAPTTGAGGGSDLTLVRTERRHRERLGSPRGPARGALWSPAAGVRGAEHGRSRLRHHRPGGGHEATRR